MPGVKVMGRLDVKQGGQQQVLLEWESSATNDMIADSALALILGIDSSPATIKSRILSKVSTLEYANLFRPSD